MKHSSPKEIQRTMKKILPLKKGGWGDFKVKKTKRSYRLVILFLLSSILIAGGCAKKVVKESELGGIGAAEEEAIKGEGEFKKEVVIGEEAKTSKVEVSKAIEGSLKGLETKEPKVTEEPSPKVEEGGGEIKEGKRVVIGEEAKTPKVEVSKAIEGSLKGLETKEAKVTEEEIKPSPKIEVSKAIEESLKGLETKEPQVTEEPSPKVEEGAGEIKEGKRVEEIQSGVSKEMEPLVSKDIQPGVGEEREGGVDKELTKPKEERLAALERIDEIARLKGRLLPIYFDFDKYSIRDDEIEKLKNNALWLMKNPNVKLLIEGHADERGSNEYNLALGDRRALSVMKYLRDLGVNVEISTVSFGEERPVCMESNEECWSKNRRVEFKIVSE